MEVFMGGEALLSATWYHTDMFQGQCTSLEDNLNFKWRNHGNYQSGKAVYQYMGGEIM